MKYLLDTHTFLWFITDDKQLSGKAKIAIENPDHAKYLSIVSIWEIAIKLNKGKLELAMPFVELKGHKWFRVAAYFI
jgi:PIN domain nuclease of toxin-antitoxin system